jgi:hypothetical protein
MTFKGFVVCKLIDCNLQVHQLPRTPSHIMLERLALYLCAICVACLMFSTTVSVSCICHVTHAHG